VAVLNLKSPSSPSSQAATLTSMRCSTLISLSIAAHLLQLADPAAASAMQLHEEGAIVRRHRQLGLYHGPNSTLAEYIYRCRMVRLQLHYHSHIDEHTHPSRLLEPRAVRTHCARRRRR